MSSDEIIDPAREQTAVLRHRLIQVGVPIAAVLLVIVAIATVGLYSYRTTREGALALSRQFLDAQQKYIALEVNDYIMPATKSAVMIVDMLAHGTGETLPDIFQVQMAALLRQVPQISSGYIADENGEFEVIERDPKGAGIEVTHLLKGNAVGFFHHDFYDASGKLVSTAENTAAGYDPRVRDWFTGTAGRTETYWGAPTLIENTRQFVITGSIGFAGAEKKRYVLAISISLNLLSDFLNSLEIGKNGHALILDRTGHLIAGHHALDVAKAVGWDATKMVLSPTQYPALSRAWDAFLINGFGPRALSVGSKRYVTVTAPLNVSRDNWVLMIVAPESDFAGFAKVDGRRSFLFALLVVMLAAGLAIMLFRQGRRTELVARKFSIFRNITRQENEALTHLAAQPDLFDPLQPAPSLTEALTSMAGASRASIWRFLDMRKRLVCEDCYDMTRDGHSGGFELSASEVSSFFDAISQDPVLSVADAATDKKTAQFHRLFMRSFGSRALDVHALAGHGSEGGVLIIEDATRADDVGHFINMIAGIAAVRIAGQSSSAPVHEAEHGATGELATTQTALVPLQMGSAFLVAPATGAQPMAQGLYPAVAVMVIIFAPPHPTGDISVDDVVHLVRELALRVQKIAQDCGLFSVKVTGYTLICTAGCTIDPDPAAPGHIVNAALLVREACLTMLAQADIEPIFRIGIDIGPVMGGTLGKDPGVFNIWGEALSVAERMAHGAPDVGTIQVTEDVYGALRDLYLFRARGVFFQQGSGIGRTYTLVGRR